MQGSLQDVNIGGLFRLLSLHQFSGRLVLRGNQGVTGVLHLAAGEITGAEHQNSRSTLVGAEAVYKILRMEKGDFYFAEGVATLRAAAKVQLSTENLILEGTRRLPENTEFELLLPPLSANLELAANHGSRPTDLSLPPQEWNTLIAFRGDKSLGEVIKANGMDKRSALRAIYGFLSAGLVKKIRYRLPNIKALAEAELGAIGAAVVENEISKMKVQPSRMTMADLLTLLRAIEMSLTTIIGKARSEQAIAKMWDEVKT